MKKLTLLIAFAFITQASVLSQSCLPEGITFTFQAQIDGFQTNYPNCTEIEGDVMIDGDDITNLNGLNVLTAIWGHLSIGNTPNNNPVLTSLSGLDNITYIGGNLLICGNNALTNLTGLEGLDSIEMLRIVSNDALTSLVGVEGLTSIGDLEINENNTLVSLTGLEGLTSVEYLSLMRNNTLAYLTGLENIEGGSINGLYIYTNIFLSSCVVQSICNCLASGSGDIVIYDNALGCNSIEEVDSLCNITDVREFNTEYEVMIFPNPATDKLHIINNSGLKIETVIIYNQVGQKVLHRNKIREKIDISTLGQGIYIIEMTSSKLKIRLKLIIEK